MVLTNDFQPESMPLKETERQNLKKKFFFSVMKVYSLKSLLWEYCTVIGEGTLSESWWHVYLRF